MLEVPTYKLSDINVYNFRDYEWNEDTIINTITSMLVCGEQYGIRIRGIYIRNKEDKSNAEIKKSKCKILQIDLSYTGSEGTEETELIYDIPWLINNHFFISGNYKVCIYQLFDKPVIKRKDLIKIRTNIQSFMLKKKTNIRKKYNFEISMFGKSFEFAKLVISYYGVDRTRSEFNINENNEYIGGSVSDDISLLTQDIIAILNDTSLDKVRLLESHFPRKTDSKILEDLSLVTEIDIFSKKYFNTNNIVEEFIYIIRNGAIDDSDYSNKRIRFAEQLIYVNLARDFYNLINSIRKNRKLKFNANSKSILSSINVSDIVQFDNSLNPLSELSMLSRTSLSGVGGFEKTNVPHSLREIHPTMLFYIDPSDTGDRDGCGTIQYLIPNTKFEDDGSFKQSDTGVINSISESFVPFLEHDDSTRLQMASSQQRHAIMLKKFDVPLIQTGVEGMYSDQTSFIFKAKHNGKVIYLDDNILCVQYDNKSCEAFYIGYKKLYISTVDFYKVYYSLNQSFNKGDIIAESNYLKNGNIVLGKNCLVAIMPWHGYNYEDGIVISQKLADEDYFTSMHYEDIVINIPINKVLLNLNDDYSNYKPLPDIGQILSKGDVCAKIKTIDTNGFEDVIFEPVTEELANNDCKVVDIKYFVNKWNKSFPQYDNFIQTAMKEVKNSSNSIVKKLSNYLTKDELDRIINMLEINQSEKNNFKFKGDYIEGIRIEITVVYERKITTGDKLGNRHGNKGIISKIAPEHEMPLLEDGRRADIVINPLGIVSRMNVGQVFEAHLGLSFTDLKKKIKEMYDNKKPGNEIYNYVIEYIKIIDKTKDQNYTGQMIEIFKDLPITTFVNNLHNFYIIQPPFESVTRTELDMAMKYTDTPYEIKIYDKIYEQWVDQPISCGYIYFMKLNHIAQDKISYRGVGPYSNKTSQPLGGKSRKGGQRLGEMEMWSIIAHGAEQNLNEFISIKSDSIKLRNKYISQMINNSELLLDSDDDIVPQSLRLLQTNLKSIGLDYQLHEGDYKDIVIGQEDDINGESDNNE